MPIQASPFKGLIVFIAVLTFLGGVVAFLLAKSAVHEILGAILILCFVVCLVSIAVLDALAKIASGANRENPK